MVKYDYEHFCSPEITSSTPLSPCRGIELNAKVRGCMNQFFHTKKKVGGPISYKLGALITY